MGKLLRQRLKETERSAEDLAEAVQLPQEYIDDLIAGRRRPPQPGQTDLYDRMTSFLRLSRNDLSLCANAEREATEPKRRSVLKPTVRRQLLELCEPKTAEELEARRAENGGAELMDFIQRLLEVTQGAVRRMLDDQIGLRVAAERYGGTYAAMRLRVLEFLDATPETLTTDDLARFLQPRVTLWDVDLETGVLRVVLRSQEPRERHRRRPNARSAF
ncbi:MAG: hypothetical protein ACYSUI_22575 [Planctomycetota bacterium]